MAQDGDHDRKTRREKRNTRQVHKIHTKAEEALVRYRAEHAERTDALIARLRLSFPIQSGLL
jgi:hypothetical protein